MNTLIIDAQNGCSGDMFVAALSQLAGNDDVISTIPEKLGLHHTSIAFSQVTRSSISARKCDVHVHDEHGHHHADHHHDHHHRHLSDIKQMIQSSALSDGCKQRAVDIFERLGTVEAQAHGIDIDAVHFHEVGAIDSIVDIVAAAACLDLINPQQVYCSNICVGSGQVKTAHGVLPIPAPATERLLQQMPVFAGDIPGEWTTPTGAAILAHLQPRFDNDITIQSNDSAYGAGGKDVKERPNVLRIRLGTVASDDHDINILHCNVDDMPAELLGADFCASALAAGARDICIRPQVMKKGRPGYLIELLCLPQDSENLSAWLCQHTSTIGVRIIEGRRYILERRATVIQTEYGEITAKAVTLPDGHERCLPEYEACAAIAREKDLPVLTVYNAALSQAQSK